jgi:membrane fusion protein, heavy metal efflux system
MMREIRDIGQLVITLLILAAAIYGLGFPGGLRRNVESLTGTPAVPRQEHATRTVSAISDVALSTAPLNGVKVEPVRPGDGRGDVPRVPVGALVLEPDGSTTVWVMIDPNQFDKRAVRIGARRDGLADVVEGLQPGEFVATNGLDTLAAAVR